MPIRKARPANEVDNQLEPVITCIHITAYDEHYCDAFEREFVLCESCMKLLDNFLLFTE